MEKELVEVLKDRFDCCDITQLVEFMVESGLLTEKNIKHYLIKYEYYKRTKQGNQAFTDIKYDLAAEFDTTYPTVKNIIYKYKHLQP